MVSPMSDDRLVNAQNCTQGMHKLTLCEIQESN